MPISSLVVQVYPDGREITQAYLEADPRIEVTDVMDQTLVILTETTDRLEDLDIWHSVKALAEVETVNLIYHNHEDLEMAAACNS